MAKLPGRGVDPPIAQLQLELTLMALPTDVKVLLAFPPNVVMAPMHTTIISANITAYSTAVGPSSRFKKSTANCPSFRMSLLQKKNVKPVQRTPVHPPLFF